MKNKLVAPVLKWVGGKRKLLATFKPLLPHKIDSYCEPFLGGGAVFLDLQPKKAYVNDLNNDLMRVYIVIRDNVDELIRSLETFTNNSETFYAVRDWDRDKQKFDALSDVQKAARTIFLNKTCYNGLYRVNNSGEFNAPFGNYKNSNIVNAVGLKAVSNYFNTAQIAFSSTDYTQVLKTVNQETFVYLDPPYDPVSNTSSFTGYTKCGFTRDDQIKLRECCDALDKKGVKFMLSNSATDFIKEQYCAYNITIVKAKRAINSVASKRGDVDEVVVRNYE